jgi:hypothetical protein
MAYPDYENPYSSMRFQSVFGQPQTIQDSSKRFYTGLFPTTPPSAEQGTPEKTRGQQYFERLQQMRETGPAVTAYQQALNEQPTYDQYAPSKAQRLAAALTSFAGAYGDSPATGMALGRGVTHGPYEQALADYKNKLAGLGESANLEMKERQYQMDDLMAAQNFGLDYDKYVATTAEARERTEIERSRAKAYIDNLAASGMKEIKQADGSVWYVDINGNRPAIKVDGRTVEAANAATAARNATTAETNAETNRFNAITSRGNTASLIETRKQNLDYLRESLVQRGVATPQGVTSAMDTALQTMITRPGYEKFIDVSDNGAYTLMPGMADDPLYDQFLKDLEAQTLSVIQTNRIGGLGNFDDLGGITFGEPFEAEDPY